MHLIPDGVYAGAIMIALLPITLMMYEGQRIVLKAWAEERAKVLARRMFRKYISETEIHLHILKGIEVVDEMNRKENKKGGLDG